MVIAGTGHRPPKLGGYGESAKEALNSTIMDWLTVNKVDRVISGGALGWDQALAVAALDLYIPLTMALPFEGFEDRWPMDSKFTLYALMEQAEKVHFVKPGPYAGWKMQARNEWMVDNCDQVLACWDGSTGGTGNCIAYANKVNKPIVNLYDEWSKYVQDNR